MALSFHTPALEQAYIQRRNAQLLWHDAVWAVFWLLFAAAGFIKWAAVATLPPLSEVLHMAAYAAWSPLILHLAQHRRGWYLRHRNSVLVSMRVVRSFLLMHNFVQREALWVAPPGCLPTSFSRVYTHLASKVNFLLLAGLGVLLPLRLHLPLHVAFLVVTLRAGADRCRLECAAAVGSAVEAAAGGACADPAAAAAASGVCSVPFLSSPAADHYYAVTLRWIRRLNPRVVGRLPARWRPGGGTCFGACFSTHAWLQAVGGVLLPLALLWLWEERLRARELRLWRRRLREQQQLQQASEPLSEPPSARSPQAAAADLPLPLVATLAWFTASAWALWLLLEALFL